MSVLESVKRNWGVVNGFEKFGVISYSSVYSVWMGGSETEKRVFFQPDRENCHEVNSKDRGMHKR